jgi:predicted PurR-regulated permease PerM
MNSDKRNSVYRYVLVGFILLLSIIIFTEMRYYLGGFMAAIAMYSILRSLMIKLVEQHKLSRGLSASIIVLGSVIFFLLPLTGIGFLVADTISGININPEQIKLYIEEFVSEVERKAGIEIFTPENLSFIPEAGKSFMQIMASSLSSMVMNSVIAIFVLYFMLVSYNNLEVVIMETLPFSEENKTILRQETRAIILSNTIGIPVVALSQAALAYVGYLFLGVNNPLVYAILVAFTTVIPVVGTSLVWVPVGLSAILTGDILRGILLLAYGLAIIGGSDAVIRFVLQKKLANIHPLITFFGVLTGLAMFGFWGIIFGPLLLSLLLLLFNMYRHDYIKESNVNPRIASK